MLNNGGEVIMPYGDKTGPEGRGPRTGRGLGYCSDRNAPGYTSTEPRMGQGRGFGRGAGFRRGAGFGRGRGIGFGRRFRSDSTDSSSSSFSKEDEINWLESKKQAIEKRLEELNKKEKE